MTDVPLDIDALEKEAKDDLTGDYPWPQVLNLISAYRRLERYAWIRGRDAAVNRARRFQDVVGWQPGESRNALIGDIEEALRALQPPEGADRSTDTDESGAT